jgi:hypothetical protein
MACSAAGNPPPISSFSPNFDKICTCRHMKAFCEEMKFYVASIFTKLLILAVSLHLVFSVRYAR